MSEDLSALVVDIGSSLCKAGLSSDVNPSLCFPSMIGHNACDVMIANDAFVGNEAQQNRDLISMRYPIQRGIVTNWDDMEMIWKYMLENTVESQSGSLPVLCSEAPFNPKQNRERMTEMIFETFSVPKFHISMSPVLVVYGSGRCSASACESGDGVTSVISVWDGYPLQYAAKRTDFAGVDVTSHLTRLLRNRNYSFTTSHERKIVREIKERMCYVVTDPGIASEVVQTSKSYKLPDGHKITVEDERYQCAEILFEPSLSGSRNDAVHELIFNSLMDTPIDCRAELFKNVVISGGNTLFPGMRERLQFELCKLSPEKIKVNVLALPDREICAWCGGSIVASLNCFQSLWVSKEDYQEDGPSIVHRKCLVV